MYNIMIESIEKEIKLHKSLRDNYRVEFLKSNGHRAEMNLYVEAGIIKGLFKSLRLIKKLSPAMKEL